MDRGWKHNLIFAGKVVAAACLAIGIAELLGLAFSVSAGIVAILSIAFTKTETVRTAMNRFVAFVAALIIAAVCFSVLGYHIPAFCVYLLLFIPLCQFKGWNSAMAMDSVLISHFLTLGSMSCKNVGNELALFAIGVGIGICANLFLRKKTDYMEELKNETDERMRQVLHRMALRIMDSDLDGYDGSCFHKLYDSVKHASAVAEENDLNQLFHSGRADIEYIAMRHRQIDVLYDMYQRVRLVHTTPITAKLLAQFFERVSSEYHRENTVCELLEGFAILDAKMKQMPLPESRAEFEDRAQLYALMRNMEEFLQIKRLYMEEQEQKN